MASNPKRKDKAAEEKLAAERLKEVSGLVNQQQDHSGLSSSFKEGIKETTEASMALCERAMEELSSVYVQSLTDFKESTDPLGALSQLEKAEEVWRKGAEVIRRYDAEGGETLFLRKMRGMASEVLESKLQSLEQSGLKLSPQHEALCLGIIGVLDLMLMEIGFQENAPERTYLRNKAKRYK